MEENPLLVIAPVAERLVQVAGKPGQPVRNLHFRGLHCEHTGLALPKGASEALRTALREFPRQALHAARLQLAHPVTGKPLEAVAPLPADMTQLLAVLAADAATGTA